MGACAIPDSGAGAGAGSARAILTISHEPSFNFGGTTVGTSVQQRFTVTNRGDSSAILSVVSNAGLGLAFPFSVAGGTCVTNGTVVANGGSCWLGVLFTPVAAILSNAVIDLRYFDGLIQQVTSRAIAGAGVAAAQVLGVDGSLDGGAPERIVDGGVQ
jgi:hypothetical protein